MILSYAQRRTPYDWQAREATNAAQDVMTTDKLYLEPHLKWSEDIADRAKLKCIHVLYSPR